MPDLHAEAERIAYRERLEVFLASRDAARQASADRLRDRITLTALVWAASDAADYADAALSIVGDEYRPRLHCREGCSYCCEKPGVLTTLPEFVRLVDFVRTTFSREAIEALVVRADAYAAQLDGRSFNDRFDEPVACPLLVDGRCAAYDVRPLVCRGYNSTNVDACRAARTNADIGVPIFAMLKDVTDGATVGISQYLQARGLSATPTVVDVGTALHVALHADADFVERVTQGTASLAGAEDTAFVDALWTAVRETARRLSASTRTSGS